MESSLVRIRREIFVRLAKAFFENNLDETIDRIPLEMRPKSGGELSRCCIYRDRVMIKYRIMASLGFGYEDEVDELTPLSEYAKSALVNPPMDEHITILMDLCSSCLETHYHITDACKGCVARPCINSCAKSAIRVKNRKAKINAELCVGCGKCVSVCPYQAIIRIPIPCEEACPTGAISPDETGKEVIDKENCILCGKCITACPFGAIAERSQMMKVLQAIKSSDHTTAIIAPSIAGQFPGSLEQLHSGLLKLGFNKVIEAAEGAVITAIEESKEFKERISGGEPFITSSCCPAYVMAVKKNVKKLKPFVSHTPSPMIFAGRIAKEKNPETKTVFIGPCLAKRKEANKSGIIDFTLTFEELGCILAAKEIDVAECEAVEFEMPAEKQGRYFAVSGGVTAAVHHCVNNSIEVKPFIVNGFNKRELKQLPGNLINRKPGNFIEVMTCEGGCVAGPGAIAKPNVAARNVEVCAEKSVSIDIDKLTNN